MQGETKTKQVSLPVQKPSCVYVGGETEASPGNSGANPASTRWNGLEQAQGLHRTPHS